MRWTERKTTGENRGAREGGEEQVGGTLPGGRQGGTLGRGTELVSTTTDSWLIREREREAARKRGRERETERESPL